MKSLGSMDYSVVAHVLGREFKGTPGISTWQVEQILKNHSMRVFSGMGLVFVLSLYG